MIILTFSNSQKIHFRGGSFPYYAVHNLGNRILLDQTNTETDRDCRRLAALCFYLRVQKRSLNIYSKSYHMNTDSFFSYLAVAEGTSGRDAPGNAEIPRDSGMKCVP